MVPAMNEMTWGNITCRAQRGDEEQPVVVVLEPEPEAEQAQGDTPALDRQQSLIERGDDVRELVVLLDEVVMELVTVRRASFTHIGNLRLWSAGDGQAKRLVAAGGFSRERDEQGSDVRSPVLRSQPVSIRPGAISDVRPEHA